MKYSKAKIDFKQRLGQANHFLITALVGVDAIKSGTVSSKPESFRTSWNPKDPKRSVIRTRSFLLRSFLGWTVESLEMYLTALYRKPKLLDGPEIEKLYSKAGQSVYKKATLLGEYIGVDPILIALMEVLITWRNYTFHYEIDNDIRPDSEALLLKKAVEINQRFRGLDINLMKLNWQSKEDFTFKETASLISATHEFVGAIDEYVLRHLDLETYYVAVLKQTFLEKQKSKQKYLSLSDSRLRAYLITLLRNKTGTSEIPDDILETILKKLPKNEVARI